MSRTSSFLGRFGSRDAAPTLPLHTTSLRPKPSEYDLQALAPQPESSVLFSADATSEADTSSAFYTDRRPFSGTRNTRPPSVAFAYQDHPSRASSRQPQGIYRDHDDHDRDDHDDRDHDDYYDHDRTRTRTNAPALFAGPPPPIAQSTILLRDEEQGGLGASIRLPSDTVVLDRSHPRSSLRGPAISGPWALLQRRDKALQAQIQTFLDAQSAGLEAGLGRGPRPQSSSGSTRSTSSSTPTLDRASRLPTERATASGAVIPVRQPRPRKLGLRDARAGLARAMAQLAELKADEDAVLAAAVDARTQALAYLARLAKRREAAARDLQTIETDDAEPLARELVTLHRAHDDTRTQIEALEAQLAALRTRQRTLAQRIEDAESQRAAGLSGYRGALKDADAKLQAVLRRPPVQPVHPDMLGSTGDADTAAAGVEFLQLRPERRTADMARAWWEAEAALLAQRRADVAAEHDALQQGGAMWADAVRLVSDFEADLRREMRREMASGVAHSVSGQGKGKGKDREPTPEERMRAQLARMADVLAGLRVHRAAAEARGWNLLICALGAEAEAFREARVMLRQSLQAAGFAVDADADDTDDDADDADLESASQASQAVDGLSDVERLSRTTPGLARASADDDDDDTATPRLARSASALDPHGRQGDTNIHAESERRLSESSNDVPPDLLGEAGDDHHDSSDNEVPLDFLSEP